MSRTLFVFVFPSFLLFACVVLGCSTTVNMIPADASLSLSEEVRLATGAGVKLLSIDEQPVQGTTARITPGAHVVHFEVRRSLRRVDLDGVFYDGECEIEIEAEPGESIEIRSLLGSETINATRRPGDYIGSTFTTFQFSIQLLSVDKKEVQQVPNENCQMRWDCRRLNTNLTDPSSECAYGNRPAFQR